MGAGELGIVAFLLFVLFGSNKLGEKKKKSAKSKQDEAIADSKKEPERKKQITHKSA